MWQYHFSAPAAWQVEGVNNASPDEPFPVPKGWRPLKGICVSILPFCNNNLNSKHPAPCSYTLSDPCTGNMQQTATRKPKETTGVRLPNPALPSSDVVNLAQIPCPQVVLTCYTWALTLSAGPQLRKFRSISTVDAQVLAFS